jgi:hypothetical protein
MGQIPGPAVPQLERTSYAKKCFGPQLGLERNPPAGKQNAERGNFKRQIFARSKWWEKVSDSAGFRKERSGLLAKMDLAL